VYRFIKTLKQESVELPQLLIPSRVSIQEMIWLILRPSDKLKESECMDLTELCSASQELTILHLLIQSFRQIVRKLEGGRLQDWQNQIEASGIPEIHRFSKGLERDKEAVLAGLTLSHSNGQSRRSGEQPEVNKKNGLRESWLPSPPPTGSSRLVVLLSVWYANESK
jgi:hypothetical protein